jgi:hypothetical protein
VQRDSPAGEAGRAKTQLKINGNGRRRHCTLSPSPAGFGQKFIESSSARQAYASNASLAIMSSLITQLVLVERYGPRLGVDQLSELLGLSKGSIYNQISAETFPISTYVDGGKRWADFRDVAEHIDHCRTRAHAAA